MLYYNVRLLKEVHHLLTSKQAYSIKNEMKKLKMKWDEWWIKVWNELIWSAFESQQISEYFLDNVQSEKNISDEISQGQYRDIRPRV